MGRKARYDWNLLLNTEEDAPCGLKEDCTGRHSAVWALHRGEDFPSSMKIFSIQCAMHAKARLLGLKCHTRTIKNNTLQVQFFRTTTEERSPQE